jgi:hypothetical protein
LIGWIRRRAAAARRDLDAAVAGRAVHLSGPARFFGLRSKGIWQIRGTGDLAATGDQIVFVQWAPRRTLTIERDAIESIDTPRWFLGKSSGRRLLRVRWRAGAEVEEAAWDVADLDGWLGVLRG